MKMSLMGGSKIIKKKNTQKIFRSKDTTNQKVNEIPTKNLLTNLKISKNLR